MPHAAITYTGADGRSAFEWKAVIANPERSDCYALNWTQLSSHDSADEVTRYIYVSADCERSAFEEIQKAVDR